MKIATWNVNSIRARKDRLLAWLQEARPDVMCLQELKCLDDEFPTAELSALGYHSASYGQKTYNGVAILARETPLTDVARGLGDDEEDPQCRLMAASVAGVRVLSVYAPNGQAVDSPAYVYKLRWFERLRRYLDTRHRPSDAVIVCGDFNVAPAPLDVHDPVLWQGQTLFSEKERAALAQLSAFGLTDLVRVKNPTEPKFTWWDYRMLSFPKGKGLRIDHLLATETLAGRCTAADVDRQARKGAQPSDHAPVWAEL
jgi:exodeoxyribonuclease III